MIQARFYSQLLVITGKAKQLRMTVWLFSESKQNGYRRDISSNDGVITAHLRNRDSGREFSEALQLLEDMMQRARYVYFLLGCGFNFPRYFPQYQFACKIRQNQESLENLPHDSRDGLSMLQ